MRIICIMLLLSICFIGCIYDPATGIITIKNNTKEAVYVYYSCADTLSHQNGLKVKVRVGANVYDANDNKVPDTMYYPQYRIPINSTREFFVGGTPSKPRVGCEDKILRIYVIDDSVMIKYSWKTICKHNLYSKKLTYSEKQLKSFAWKITLE